MKYFIDASIVVQIDRQNKKIIEELNKLVKNHDVFISVISISEILTGSFLRKDYEKAIKKAKRIMGQFIWVDVDPLIAEKTAEINAYLIMKGKKIEIQDVIIVASFLILKCDYVLTLNLDHFKRIPALENKVITPEELTL
ncbi:MAG: PIN domain-containing protein [Candidatus Helarchaeota archaeon]